MISINPVNVGDAIVSIRGWFYDKKLRNRKHLRYLQQAQLYGLQAKEVFDYNESYTSPHVSELHLQSQTRFTSHRLTAVDYLYAFAEDKLSPMSPNYLAIVNEAGMGKTALLAEFVIDNEKRPPHKQNQILLFKLGSGVDLGELKKDSPTFSKNNTIVLLDGLDEDPQIQSEAWPSRIAEIADACSDYRKVVVTCRPMYFWKICDHLNVEINRVNRHDGIQDRVNLIQASLQPFTTKQLNEIIKQRFSYLSPHRSWKDTRRYRRIAKKFIGEVDEAAFRPLVLNYIQSIVLKIEFEDRALDQGDRPTTRDSWFLYETIVNNWERREEDKLTDPKMVQIINSICRELALRSYLGQAGDLTRFVSDAQLTPLLRKAGINASDDVNMLERSLLRRIGENWYFVHQSIGEFLFVEQFLNKDNETERKLVVWTDLMKKLALCRINREEEPNYALCDFSDTNFSGLDLRSLDFSGANLSKCIFKGAVCDNTNFTGAILNNAIFDYTSTVDKADFSGAVMSDVLLDGVQLDLARNLPEEIAIRMQSRVRPKINLLSSLRQSLTISGRILEADLGISIGTQMTVIYLRDKGIVLREPSVIALSAVNRGVIAIGTEARRMIGRTPANIVAVHPIKRGIITDFMLTATMLSHFVGKIHIPRKFELPVAIIAVPISASDEERQAFENAALQAGMGEVQLVESPLATAIGVGLPVQEPVANLIVDLGAGTTGIMLISLSGICASRSVRFGGSDISNAIINYMKETHNLAIGEQMAEEVKIRIGDINAVDGTRKENSMRVKGRGLLSGQPESVDVTSGELSPVLLKLIDCIIANIQIVLKQCPADLSGDLLERGIVLSGGVALLRGLDEVLMAHIHIPVFIADDPLNATAEGLGKILPELKSLRAISQLQ